MSYLIITLALMTPSVVIAQDVGTSEIPGWLQAIIFFACAFGTFILEIARRYFGKAMDLAAQKTKLAFLAQIDDVVMSKVMELWQIESEALKAAAEDGKLTQAEKDDLKNKAIDWAKSLLDPQLLVNLFGAGNVDKALGTVVEKSVLRTKSATAAVKPVDPS